MPVPPAVSCASDGGECPCALPQYKSGERWGIVSTCGRWRVVFADGKNALMRGGMAIHRFFAAEKPRDGAGARSACFPPSSKASAPVPVRFAAGFLLVAELTKRTVFPFAFAWCGRAKSKIRSHGVLFTAGVFPILSIAHSQEGGGGLLRRQRHLLLPCALCRRVFALCGITKRAVFPVGNGGGVQNSRQKAKSWSKVRANCRNRAQNY